MRIITYAIDQYTNLVFSRFTVDGHCKGIAIPVLDFAGMKPENNFRAMYQLETFPCLSLSGNQWAALTWTKKVSLAWKNVHRAYWGLKKIRE